jgi:hypothetical protein
MQIFYPENKTEIREILQIYLDRDTTSIIETYNTVHVDVKFLETLLVPCYSEDFRFDNEEEISQFCVERGLNSHLELRLVTNVYPVAYGVTKLKLYFELDHYRGTGDRDDPDHQDIQISYCLCKSFVKSFLVLQDFVHFLDKLKAEVFDHADAENLIEDIHWCVIETIRLTSDCLEISMSMELKTT